MSATAEMHGIDVGTAIKMAFDHFETFFERHEIERVLLEGVQIDEKTDDWLITIGFDAGRQRVLHAKMIPGLDPDETIEPVRELREFRLDGHTGNLKTMRSLTL